MSQSTKERWQWPVFSEKLREQPDFKRLCHGSTRLGRMATQAAAWLFEELGRELNRPLLIIVPRESQLLDWIEAARYFSARDEEIFSFPSPPLTPYQETEASLSLRAQEAVALDRLRSVNRPTVVCTPRALWHPLPESARHGETIWIRRGEDLDLGRIALDLVALGYRRTEMVADVGSFALRGGILDVFPPGEDEPARLDFFGDTIEDLRTFDVATQTSLESIDSVRLRPMSPISADPETAMQLAELLEDYLPSTATTEARGRIDALRSGDGFPGWDNYLPLMMASKTGLLDLIGAEARVVAVDPKTLLAEMAHHQELLTLEYHTRLEQGRVAVPPELLTVDRERVSSAVAQAHYTLGDDDPEITFDAVETSTFVGQLPRFPREVEIAHVRAERVVVVGLEEHQERLREMLENRGLFAGGSAVVGASPQRAVELVVGELTRGFRWPQLGLSIYAEGQLVATRKSRKTPKRALGAFVSTLRDLRVGEHVVHEDHGIGKFLGMRALEGPAHPVGGPLPDSLAGMRTKVSGVEVMEIEYRNGRTLLLPLDRIHQIQRYSGIDGLAPRLDELGGASWNKKKSRIKSGLKQLATDLLELYAQRSLATAPMIGADSDLLRQFETHFEFEETPDQLDTIEAIKKDLESSKPMDRLLVGDVGFGKTEVALRAAFKVVDAGHQVAILAPTTILADQHLQTLQKRLENFPINVEMVSRLRTPAEIKDIRKRLASGEIDILVGTHRLLSKDMQMPKLALLVIDEEQRFGVAQKEKLTDLRKNLHVLALSATPVPRTLQLSLAGVRDLSTIETPPKDRMAVETRVVPFDAQLIREAVEFELERGGQAFYVYNKVEDIERMALFLRELVPGLKVTVGHGQMDERELSLRMRAFKRGEHDLLLATTIIENGIDIPNVNTMFVHRADQFGLGQLYQLRGRVGRSDQLGFCYLMVPADRILKEDARKRLQTIEDFSELGAGFRVAGRDLEIRGAGNLLGAEQSGHISDVGIETYMRMLEEAIKELRGEVVEEVPSAAIDLPLMMSIPSDYIRDDNLRMEIYSRLASADQITGALLEELRDRFGPPPQSVLVLAEAARLKKRAEELRIQSISAKGDVLSLRLRRDARVDVERLIQLVTERGDSRFTPSGVLQLDKVAPEEWIPVAFQVLETIARRDHEPVVEIVN